MSACISGWVKKVTESVSRYRRMIGLRISVRDKSDRSVFVGVLAEVQPAVNTLPTQ